VRVPSTTRSSAQYGWLSKSRIAWEFSAKWVVYTIAILALFVAGASAFHMAPSFKRSAALSMALTAPGKNMKPQFDGTFKEAGAHLETYVLEHDNGSKALVDTKTATCISWKTADGKEVITSKASVHRYPNLKTTLSGEFVPEERAKKVSFDRMIFKTEGVDGTDIEYRSDVTMRADSLEYDITIINKGAVAQTVTMGLNFNIAPGYKVTDKKGYTVATADSVATAAWTIPVGKFKETTFFAKISK